MPVEQGFYFVFLAGWTVLAVAVFFLLLAITVPYGRFARPGWGPSLPSRWGWLLMESPALIVFWACFLAGRPEGAVPLVCCALWSGHYAYRSLIYPWLLRSARPVPLSVAVMGMAFQVVNSYLQGRWLFHFAPPYPEHWLVDPRFLGGLALFGLGFAVHAHADAILRRLRAGRSAEYGVPQGGLFGWVSCPNYLGELIEWTGWALLTWSWAGLSFAVWTAANLVPRALAYHRWYRATLPGYPPERKAIVPFIL